MSPCTVLVVSCSEYGNPVKRRRSFLAAMAKLDDNIMYLCFSQVSPSQASTVY